MPNYRSQLEALTRLRGIRGAMVVAGTDGLVVAESLMEDVKGPSLAALAATLAAHATELARHAGRGVPRLVHLQCAEGAVLAAPSRTELVLVAVAGRDVPLGQVRLEMLQLAEQLV